MKTYFTKYLPVEGEIKKGDWIKNEYNLCKCNEVINKDFILCSAFAGASFITDWKKVKLSLCSRDIQIGDKVNAGSKETFTYTRNEDPKIDLSNQFFFKVIGEISPQAMWILEGDWFDEEEWRWATYDFDTEIMLDKSKDLSGLPCLLQIKGPCGHFH